MALPSTWSLTWWASTPSAGSARSGRLHRADVQLPAARGGADEDLVRSQQRDTRAGRVETHPVGLLRPAGGAGESAGVAVGEGRAGSLPGCEEDPPHPAGALGGRTAELPPAGVDEGDAGIAVQ